MSDESDLINLYSARILGLAADIPHTDRLDAPQASAKKRSPLCGSTVTVDVNLFENTVSAYAQDVKACALGQAAASVVGAAILGTTTDQIRRARDELYVMLKSDGPVPSAPFDGLEVLCPAKEYKNRHASILLALDATLAAIDDIQAQKHA
jgi:NifU-like protein involved in Fe-S cluster formation